MIYAIFFLRLISQMFRNLQRDTLVRWAQYSEEEEEEDNSSSFSVAPQQTTFFILLQLLIKRLTLLGRLTSTSSVNGVFQLSNDGKIYRKRLLYIYIDSKFGKQLFILKVHSKGK